MTGGAGGHDGGRAPPDPFRRIVWPLAVAETIVWAAMYYAFPALLLTWEQAFGWSKTELAGAFTLSLLVSATLAPVSGRLIDHGFGRSLFAGSALLGASLLAALSLVTQMWQFYLVWIGMGVAMAGALYEPCFAVLTRLMGSRARQAITLVTLVAGLAGTVSFPSAHLLVGWVGWRGAVLVFAAAVALIAVPLIWRSCGLGEQHGEAHAPKASSGTRDMLLILRKPTFWLLAVSFSAIALNHGALLTHLLPLLDERGIHRDTAVIVASMIGPMQVAGRLAMIAAERHVSMLGIAVACFVATLLAAAALLGAGAVPMLLIAFVVLQGAGYGVTSIVRPVITADLLGRKNFGVVAGMLAFPFLAMAALAPTAAALVWHLGGYDRVIQAAAFTSAVGLVALLGAIVVQRRPPTSG